MVLDAAMDQLGGWLRDVRAERRAAKENAAAQLLCNATVLVRTMRDYDNQARSAYLRAHPLASEEPDADEDPSMKEIRRAAYEKLQSFEEVKGLIYTARDALTAVKADRAQIADAEYESALDTLIDRGKAFIDVTGKVRHAKEQYLVDSDNGLYKPGLLRSMGKGFASADIAAYAQGMLDRLAPLSTLVDEAVDAYSGLSVTIRRMHHLPPLPAKSL
jgi:hypothetical protein